MGYYWDNEEYIVLTNVHMMDNQWNIGVFGWCEDHVVMILHGTKEGKIKDGYGTEFEPSFVKAMAHAWARNEGLPIRRDSVVRLVVCFPTRVRARYPDAWMDDGVEFVGWSDGVVYARPQPTSTGMLVHVWADGSQTPNKEA